MGPRNHSLNIIKREAAIAWNPHCCGWRERAFGEGDELRLDEVFVVTVAVSDHASCASVGSVVLGNRFVSC